MTFTRSRITTSDDCDVPRVASLGSGVVWYAYRRSADKGLYVQRELNGVMGAETLIAAPVDYIDVAVDQDDARAWIYFTCDGALRAIEVTDKTEALGPQIFQRGQGWHERISTRALGGAGVVNAMGFTDEFTSAFRLDDGPVEVYPPTISVLDIGSPTQALLVIEPRPVTFGVVNKFRVFRQTDHDGAGWGWYSDVALPTELTQVTLTVPRSAYPAVSEWVATAVRYHYPEESAWSNVVRDDQLGETVRTLGLGGAGVGHDYALVDKTPIKISAPTEYVGFGKLGGAGVGHRWTVNGIDIITP